MAKGQRGSVDIPLGGGIDESLSKELVPNPSAASLVNVQFDQKGAWARRPSRASTETLSAEPNSLALAGAAESVLVKLPTSRASKVESFHAVSENGNIMELDSARSGDYLLLAFRSSSSDYARVALFDTSTMSLIDGPLSTFYLYRSVRVVKVADDDIRVFGLNFTSDLAYLSYDVTDGFLLASESGVTDYDNTLPTTLASDIKVTTANTVYAVCAQSTAVYAVYRNTSDTMTIASTATAASFTISSVTPRAVAIEYEETSGDLFVASRTSSSTYDVGVYQVPTTLSSSSTIATAHAVFMQVPTKLSLQDQGNGTVQLLVSCSVTEGDTIDGIDTQIQNITVSDGSFGSFIFRGHMGVLLAEPSDEAPSTFATVTHISETGDTDKVAGDAPPIARLYEVGADVEPKASFGFDRAISTIGVNSTFGDVSPAHAMAKVHETSTHIYVPYLRIDSLGTGGKAVGSDVGVGTVGDEVIYERGIAIARIQTDLGADAPIPSARAQGLTYFAGGNTFYHDGRVYRPANPMQRPHIYGDDVVSGDPAVTASLTTASHSVRLVFRWVDHVGNTHRSAPSDIYAYSATATTAPRLYFNVPPEVAHIPAQPLRTVGGSQIIGLEAEIYSDRLSSSTDFLLSDVQPVKVANSSSVGLSSGQWGVGFVWDMLGDPEADSKVLYSESGELLSEEVPSMIALTSSEDRLWGVSSDNPLDVYYSKAFTPNIAVEWNRALSLRIPAEGGPCTAIKSLSDKVVVFKRRGIYVIFGSGPNNLGIGAFNPPRRIYNDIGALSHAGCVETPVGLFFVAERGVHLLTPGLQLQFIGEAVKDSLNPRNITNSWVMGDQTEVYFASPSDDKTFIYDYRVNAWTSDSYPDKGTNEAVNLFGGVIYQNEPTFLVEDENAGSWRIVQENSSNGSVGEMGPMSVTTPWIKLSGLQGFHRTRMVTLFGTYYSDDIVGTWYVDYDDSTSVQSRTWSSSTDLPSTGSPMQLRWRPSYQKNQSFSIKLAQSGNTGKGYKLTMMRVDYTTKGGANRYIVAERMK